MTSEKDVKAVLLSLRDMASLEAQTISAEINLFGRLRDWLAPAARYGVQIQTRYRRSHYKIAGENEQYGYLSEGFSLKEVGRPYEGGKPLNALLVVDNFSTVELPAPPGDSGNKTGQYIGERLYLTRDKKWIVAERLGVFSEKPGSVSEWNADCRVIPDRSLLEQHTLESITEGLFLAINRLWENLSPRMDALKKRNERVSRVSEILTALKDLPPEVIKLTQDTPPAASTDSEDPFESKG